MTRRVSAVIILIFTLTVNGQNPSTDHTGDLKNRCTLMTSCSDCISAGPQCAWCQGRVKGLSHTLDKSRCDLVDELTRRKCSDIYHPQYSVKIKQNLEFGQTEGELFVQLRPQLLHIPIKPNSHQEITVQFKKAKNYPVDLYFLMDMSYTMMDDKEKVEALGDKIGRTMSKITNDFRLGFGSFVDKQLLPFSLEFLPNETPMCGQRACAPPYGFKNHMSLSENATEFVNQIRKSKTSYNLDHPEGGLDAIMQAVVCTKEIGWRDQARKIILVTTDDEYHLAGDGKLGGLVIPNDCTCHLDKMGKYTMSAVQDYASIGQINFMAKQKQINILFAVTSEKLSIYKELSKRIEACYFGELKSDSSNVLDLITDIYKKISSSVTLKDNSTGNVQLTYYPRCSTDEASSDGKQSSKAGNTCKNLKVGNTAVFDVKIEVSSCPKSVKDRRQIVRIYPVGISESLLIDLEIKCKCNCGTKVEKSQKCFREGTFECGICTCPAHRAGLVCECDSNRANVIETDFTACKPPNSSTVCSGRGSCICGVCVCNVPTDPDQKIFGALCQLDNFNCKKQYGLICGGSERGECFSGAISHCVCKKGFKGETCSCPDHDRDCAIPGGEICNGKGVCNCGICECQAKDKFVGSLCQDWDPQSQCKTEIRNCVMCDVFPDRAAEEKLSCQECNIMVERNETTDARSEQKCELYKDEENCYYFYFQEHSGPEEVGRLRFNDERECPTPNSGVLIGCSIVGAILGIGIGLLLIWKILTTLYDRREYAKFENERMAVKWGKESNPLYHQPVTIFENPTFGKRNSRW